MTSNYSGGGGGACNVAVDQEFADFSSHPTHHYSALTHRNDTTETSDFPLPTALQQSQVHQHQVQLQSDLPERVSLLSLSADEELFSTPPSISETLWGRIGGAVPKFYVTPATHPDQYLPLNTTHYPRNNSTPSFAAFPSSSSTGATFHPAGGDAMIFHPSRFHNPPHGPPTSPLSPLAAVNGKRSLVGHYPLPAENGSPYSKPLLGGASPQHHHAAPHAAGGGSRLAMSMMGATTAIAMSMTPPSALNSSHNVPPHSLPVTSSGPTVEHHGASSPTCSMSGGFKQLESTLKLKLRGGFEPHQLEPLNRHKGELSIHEKYGYDLSRAQLKASSRTSALLAGFAMVALVELQYDANTPRLWLIILGITTTLLVSVHLLALMMSTCLLPTIEANGCTQDSPHIKLKFYIKLSWFFSTCIGLLLFLLEIGVIFFVKFLSVGYTTAGYITTAMLVPVVLIFVVISYLIHREVFSHSMDRVSNKVEDLHKVVPSHIQPPSRVVQLPFQFLSEEATPPPGAPGSIHRNMVEMGLQSLNVVKNV